MPLVSHRYAGADSEDATILAAAHDPAWRASQRHALRWLKDRGTGPVIRGRRWSYYVARRHAFVVERARPGYTVTAVPSG
jgi:hypothetical protein